MAQEVQRNEYRGWEKNTWGTEKQKKTRLGLQCQTLV